MSGNRSFFMDMQTRKMTLKDIFSDVFKKHSSNDVARVFIAGTPLTTPREANMLSDWQKPFVFAYFFIFSALFMLLSYLLANIFSPGYYYLMIALATVVPITLLLLVWEMNIPRNIPLYEVLVIVGIGGILSLIATIMLGNITGDTAAVWAPLTEEPAKLIVIYLVLKKRNYKFTLNGVLIGMAVGTGFSVFENVLYTLNAFVGNLSYLAGTRQAYVRALTDIAGHGLYAGLYGGALVMVKGESPVSLSHLGKANFLKYFAFSFGLHMLNNSGLIVGGVYVHAIVTSVLGIIIFLPMLRNGVNEVVFYVMNLNNGSMTMALHRDGASTGRQGGGSVQQLPGGTVTVSFVSGAYTGQQFSFTAARPFSLGRTAGRCDLAIPACVNVSSCHCSLQVANGIICIMDLNSTNGTYVEGSRLTPMSPRQLHSGAVVYLGGADCAFQVRLT